MRDQTCVKKEKSGSDSGDPRKPAIKAGMIRIVSVAILALAGAACAAERSREYVVRLDLDQIAAQTAARDHAPGFASLRG